MIVKLDDGLRTFSFNPFFASTKYPLYSLDANKITIADVFPDKLKNLNGYEYQVILFEDPPIVRQLNGITYAQDISFIKTLVDLQNARFRAIAFTVEEAEGFFVKTLYQGSGDISLNKNVFLPDEIHLKSVSTFETDGNCALIPYPERKSHFDFMFQPFDLSTWLLIVASMIGCSIVWHYLKQSSAINSNSAAYFIFSFVSNFLGQSIPFRKHGPTQKLILQLSIALTFILGTAYQSIMISLIAESRFGNRITTIDELISSNFSIYAGNIFIRQINGSEFYQQIKSRLIEPTDSGIPSFKDLALRQIVVIHSCRTLDVLMNEISPLVPYEKKPINFYYKLDEKFNTYHLHFPTALHTYFLQKFNDFSMMVFESGIKYIWYARPPYEDLRALKEREYYENEEYLLNILDLIPAFVLLATGLTLSTVIFLLSIFWDDFLSKFDWKKRTEKFCRGLLKPKVNTQIIAVRPVNQLESKV